MKTGRDGTPLLDEKAAVEQLEEGEIDNDATPTSPLHSPWPNPAGTLPPPPVGAAVQFIDTSVPPPNLVAAFPPTRPPFNNPAPISAFNNTQERPAYDAYGGPPPGFGGVRMPAIPPPVPFLNPDLMPRGRGGHRPTLLGVPPPVSSRGDSYTNPSRGSDRER